MSHDVKNLIEKLKVKAVLEFPFISKVITKRSDLVEVIENDSSKSCIIQGSTFCGQNYGTELFGYHYYKLVLSRLLGFYNYSYIEKYKRHLVIKDGFDFSNYQLAVEYIISGIVVKMADSLCHTKAKPTSVTVTDSITREVSKFNRFVESNSATHTPDIIFLALDYVENTLDDSQKKEAMENLKGNANYLPAEGYLEKTDLLLSSSTTGKLLDDEEDDDDWSFFTGLSPLSDFVKKYTKSNDFFSTPLGSNSIGSQSSYSGGSFGDETSLFEAEEFLSNFEKFLDETGQLDSIMKLFMKSISLSINRLTINYKEQLKEIIGGLFKNDYSTKRPNSRYLYTNLIYPTMINQKVKIILGFDYSGSITNDALIQEISAIEAVLANYQDYEVTIIAFTTEVVKSVTFEFPETIESKLQEIGEEIGEKGGTLFGSFFNEVMARDDLDQIGLVMIVSGDGAGESLDMYAISETLGTNIVFLLEENNVSMNNAAKYYAPGVEFIYYPPVEANKDM